MFVLDLDKRNLGCSLTLCSWKINPKWLTGERTLLNNIE